MCFRERSYNISKLKRTVKMIDFLYKSKVRKSILLRTFLFYHLNVKTFLMLKLLSLYKENWYFPAESFPGLILNS